jgi:ABC-type amino acid transport substrate-binding protein
VPLARVADGLPLLLQRRLDAILADNLQLTWLQAQQQDPGRTRLALQGIRPESQAFAFGSSLPSATAERIDLAISALKRNGLVADLRGRILAEPSR